MKVVLGSSSERKIKTAERIFNTFFKDKKVNVVGHPAVSGVPDTPYDKQTLDGARNRAMDSQKSHQGDCFVGLESGLVERYGDLYEEAWACIITKDGKEYLGYSSGLKLPHYVIKKMKDLGKEHCDAMTVIEEELGKLPNDTWGTYSGGILSRELSLEEALRNAVVQMVDSADSLYHK
jgi:non-canonical (house-cleaning) NTP pyrophosphatase